MRRISLLALAAIATAICFAPPADAFCGFYVAPSDQPLYNDASMVALMRDGTRTVMSMSNNYKGPAADFAMVVPVPVVLQKENVKTLPLDTFQKLEALSAPRLVEYWEQDPCTPGYPGDDMMKSAAGAPPPAEAEKKSDKDYGVKIEAKFTVGEYDILILSATQSDGLEHWLVDNKYNIPRGASGALAPYIKEQQKFFVAKVDIQKVRRDAQGVSVLSPLRFSYESADFRLPVRLGLLNAQSRQDLIVYVLSKGKRYEAANYKNAFIPTNLEVSNETRDAFAPFYATLFDAALVKAGGSAIVTEYAWESSSCDPCPTPPLEDSDIATLGGDVLFGMGAPASSSKADKDMGGYYGGASVSMVLTRLHTRYDQTTLKDDIVFRAAEPVVGGREFVTGDNGELEKGARPDTSNNFQARYAIRHRWSGPIACSNPRRGIWGGNPKGEGTPPAVAARNLAAAPRGTLSLTKHVLGGLEDVPSWEAAAAQAHENPAAGPPRVGKGRRACACDIPGGPDGQGKLGLALSVVASALLLRRKRDR
jgi:MYXO-CTERM domain-containing protein